MSFKNITELIQTLSSRLNPSKIGMILRSLGIYLVDHNNHRIYPKIEEQKLEDLEDFFFKGAWMDRLHPKDREKELSIQKRLLNGTGDGSQEVYWIQGKKEQWIYHKRKVLLRNKDGSPWIVAHIIDDPASIKKSVEEKQQPLGNLYLLTDAIHTTDANVNFDEITQRLLEQGKRLLPFDRATVQVLHDGFLNVIGGIGFSDPQACKQLRFPYPEKDSPNTRVVQKQRAWISRDITHDFKNYVQLEPDRLINSWLGVPLITHGEVIGLMSLASVEKDFFNEGHLEIANIIAGSVAIALKEAKLHGETYKLAMEDALTGIGNRHSFNIKNREILDRTIRYKQALTLAMLDVDHFKAINDNYGHLVGDRILRQICQTSVRELRTSDLIARYGGDEVVILFPNTKMKEAKKIMDRIVSAIAKIRDEQHNFPVTISAGLSSIYPNQATSLFDLTQQADKALYSAKENGRNRVEVYMGNSTVKSKPSET